jgi:hypothetical protein
MRRISAFAGLLCYAVGVVADGSGHCEQLFDESRSLIQAEDEAESEQARMQVGDRLVAVQLKAVTAYLNQCTDRQRIPDGKSPELQTLVRLASLNCTKRQAEMEWLDVDQDGSSELVLHGLANSCDHVSIYEEGWSGVFFRDSMGGPGPAKPSGPRNANRSRHPLRWRCLININQVSACSVSWISRGQDTWPWKVNSAVGTIRRSSFP